MKLVMFGRPAFIFCLAVVAILVYRLRIHHVSKSLRLEFDMLLKGKCAEDARRCNQLLIGIEQSKLIAEKALSSASDPEHVRQALRDISINLSQCLT